MRRNWITRPQMRMQDVTNWADTLSKRVSESEVMPRPKLQESGCGQKRWASRDTGHTYD